jgi:hypothetical protein
VLDVAGRVGANLRLALPARARVVADVAGWLLRDAGEIVLSTIRGAQPTSIANAAMRARARIRVVPLTGVDPS